ncbi:MAG: hypothetical protein P1T08_15460 [Acidimicrobiia bacterium]|nr:hypothetical protein [Acidimicrobiia bacterium]
MTVSAEQRSGLARAVSRLRNVFEEDFANLAEGKFGIYLSGRRAGEVDAIDALSLSAHDVAARSELVGVIGYLLGEGLGAAAAVERMLREAVFTTVNRLLAIRVAEAIGVLPPSLASGTTSQGFVEALEGFPLLREADDSGGYWTYLQICGDELSHAVPRLFDRRNPLSSLVPSADVLERAVTTLSDPDLADMWVEPDALGWAYQFFNTQEERVEAKSQDHPHALAVRTQFFTPGYVVDFLVQNTLGRRLRESGFGMELPLLIGDIQTGNPVLELADVAVLDPAVGSAHFLLGAYEILERAWREMGVSSTDAAPKILGSLYGIEIDNRAAQVAQAVLYLRARQSAPDGRLDAPAIVTARPLPKDPAVRSLVMADVSSAVRDIVMGLDALLEQAPVLGSLLKPEEYLRSAIGERVKRPQLGDAVPKSYEEAEASVLEAVSRIASDSASTTAERLFAADAHDALRFAELCARRYDAIVMNPPFGECLSAATRWLKQTYGSHATELYSAFAQRGIELANSHGYVGTIAARPGFFLKSFEKWRSDVVIPRLVAAADFGYGAVEAAVVEITAFVSAGMAAERTAAFWRLLNERDKEAAMGHPESADLFRVHSSDFLKIPGIPLAYWVSPTLRELFERPRLGDGADVQHGASSKDDFRFLRLWWEVPARAVGKENRWVPFAKGGEYAPYFADLHLLIDWEDDARRIAASVTSKYPYLKGDPEWVLHRASRHFEPGLTYTRFTTSDFGPRVLPAGAVFSDQGFGVFASGGGEANYGLLGYLNTRLVRYLLDLQLAAGEGTQAGTPGRKYEISKVQVLPYFSCEGLTSSVQSLVRYHQSEFLADETSHLFLSPRALVNLGKDLSAVEAIQLAYGIEIATMNGLGLDEAAVSDLVIERGLHPAEYPARSPGEMQDLRTLWKMPIAHLASEAVKRAGGARHLAVQSYWVDRRLELLSHVLEAHPESIVAAAEEMNLPVRPTEPRLDISYCLGLSLGRWDLRHWDDGRPSNALPDPFDPLPVCSPGMLTDDDGLPSRTQPEGYPLALPPDRILVDDPDQAWDVVHAVETVAEILFRDADRELRRAMEPLKARDLRSLFRSRFFMEHVTLYSKSRRKAPIYWYLSVPSREWGLWVYAPWLSREQLFAIARHAQDKLRRLSDEAAQLRRDVEARGRDVRERLELVDDLHREVKVFQERAEAVAQSGWEPDLNDGIILNAAPLEDLFADPKWRKDVAEHRKKMEKGEYPWATVQRDYFDRLKA